MSTAISRDDFQRYLHQHIPLSQAMQVELVSLADDHLSVSAPLEPNLNHRGTFFGGSASTLCILSAWSLLYTRLRAAGRDCRLVIRRNSMEYTRPVEGRATATARLAEPAGGDTGWEAFLQAFDRRGKARIRVVSVLSYDGQEAGRLEGEFIALAHDDTTGAGA
ncbi:YiiD C-terminal domain-containing protein [Uliginosibacterium sp. H1]|uniref:YiiD C-terminal domain-containing protein n=1 Tax=Uliginosibacterium sp. H1 TaxID=3114757 RepID=UPI002E196643|nr:YiiD C-terminal domain-containing protein [Uliginosibacterium sp. H1]